MLMGWKIDRRLLIAAVEELERIRSGITNYIEALKAELGAPWIH
jgi:hypothetical protein